MFPRIGRSFQQQKPPTEEDLIEANKIQEKKKQQQELLKQRAKQQQEEQEEEDEDQDLQQFEKDLKKVSGLSKSFITYTKEDIINTSKNIIIKDELQYYQYLDNLDFDIAEKFIRDKEDALYHIDPNTKSKILNSRKNNLLMSSAEEDNLNNNNNNQEEEEEEGYYIDEEELEDAKEDFEEKDEIESIRITQDEKELEVAETYSQYTKLIGYPGKWEGRRSRFNSMMLSAGDMNEGMSFGIQRPLGHSFVVLHNILLCPKPPQGMPPGSAPESDYSFGVSLEKNGFSMFGRTHYSGQTIASIQKVLTPRLSTDISLVTHRAYGFKEYNWNMDYRLGPNTSFGFKLKKGNIVGLSFMQSLTNSIDAGSEFSYDYAERKSTFGIGFRYNRKFNPLAGQATLPKSKRGKYFDPEEVERRKYYAQHLFRTYLTNLAYADINNTFKPVYKGMDEKLMDSILYGYFQKYSLGYTPSRATIKPIPSEKETYSTPEEYFANRSRRAILRAFRRTFHGMAHFELENEYTFDFFLRDNTEKNITEAEAKLTAVKEIGDRKHALSEIAYNFSTKQARARFGLEIIFQKGKFKFSVDPNLHLMMAYETQLHRAIHANFTMNAHPEKGDYKFGVSLNLQ